MPRIPSLSDDYLNGRDIDKHIEYLKIGHSFLDDVDSDTLRKWLNGDTSLGEGDKSALEAAKDEITDTDDLNTLENMADHLGYWSEVLSELGIEGEDPEEWDDRMIAMIRGAICKLLDSEAEARDFCDEFSVDYERWFDPQDPNADEFEELASWLDLKEQAESRGGERFRDMTLVNEDKWVDYCRQWADDIGEISRDSSVADFIDWEKYADHVRQDFGTIEVDGNTFLVRN
jgi:hypothetical protein